MFLLLAHLGAAADPAPLVAAGCTLCHEVPGTTAAPRTESCAGCHAWIVSVAAHPESRARAMDVFPRWERYEHNVRTYLAVPSLLSAAARLEPAWVDRYLADPHDLRPGLPESMPRFGLDAAERAAITAWFASAYADAPPSPRPDPRNIAAGQALFATRGCVACHAFGASSPGPGVGTAPDLRFARERMTADHAAAWILDPLGVSPAATMPAMGLTPAEAVQVRDFLFLADPGGPVATVAVPFTSSASGPPPANPTWSDVEERVFGRICVHCHMDPAQNGGRRGPGNAGGFGWDATGIELQTEAGVRAQGDAILAALERRTHEGTRDSIGFGVAPATVDRPELPGMPLGLPPLSPEDIEMVRRWLKE